MLPIKLFVPLYIKKDTDDPNCLTADENFCKKRCSLPILKSVSYCYDIHVSVFTISIVCESRC